MKLTRIVVLIAIGLGGCVTPPIPPEKPSSGWGEYRGTIQTEWLADGRNMILLSDATYTAPNGTVWLAPKGWKVDGATIPQAFWSIIGGPFEGRYRNASVFHDVACDKKNARWQDVHLMFYNAMRCSGENEETAKIMYASVYRFARRWGEPTLNALIRPQAFLPVNRNPTKEEAKQIAAWIRTNKPSLEQIRQSTVQPGAPSP